MHSICSCEFGRLFEMSRKPLAPEPDKIDPHAPVEAPGIASPSEQPVRGAPEFVCPPDPSDTPDSAPIEQPAPDPDD